MKEYILSLLFVAFVIAVFSFISYNERERTLRFAFGVLLSFAALFPLVDALPRVNIDGIIENIQNGIESGEHIYEADAKSAFERGICKAICEKFSFDESNVTVFAKGFDFEKMNAEKIEVTLYGGAIFADVEGIEKYVSGFEIGECYVSIGI